jgi:aspartate/methionine/tyrosine aminotransferase
MKPKAVINLSMSDLLGLAREELAVDWDGLEINGDHPFGHPPLLEAIAARNRARVDNAYPVVGASQGIFSICAALLGPGTMFWLRDLPMNPFWPCPGCSERTSCGSNEGSRTATDRLVQGLGNLKKAIHQLGLEML